MQLCSKLYIQPLIRPKSPLSLPHSKNLIAGGWRILPHPNRIGLNHDWCDWKPTSMSQRWSNIPDWSTGIFWLSTNKCFPCRCEFLKIIQAQETVSWAVLNMQTLRLSNKLKTHCQALPKLQFKLQVNIACYISIKGPPKNWDKLKTQCQASPKLQFTLQVNIACYISIKGPP